MISRHALGFHVIMQNYGRPHLVGSEIAQHVVGHNVSQLKQFYLLFLCNYFKGLSLQM